MNDPLAFAEIQVGVSDPAPEELHSIRQVLKTVVELTDKLAKDEEVLRAVSKLYLEDIATVRQRHPILGVRSWSRHNLGSHSRALASSDTFSMSSSQLIA